MEILIVGYLSMKKVVKDLVIDPNYIKTLLSYFESNQISPILLSELNKNVPNDLIKARIFWFRISTTLVGFF